jgi:cholesterol oxidase
MPTRVEFKEEMKGFVQIGESDYKQGEKHGEPLAVHLKITTEEIDLFLMDPRHKATVQGYIRYGPLGGHLPIDEGEFVCLTDGEHNSRQMRYRLRFHGKKGTAYILSGVKFVRHDGIHNLWRDCSTLFTGIVDEQHNEPIAAGIIHVRPLDFAVQLTTFRGRGGSLFGNVAAPFRFEKFFLGALWDVYKRKRRPRAGFQERRITAFTLRGVEKVEISTHHITTADHLTLSMFRFKRAVCSDVVVLLHGLTTSSDMFIMPEHYNIVNYLLDNGYTDVWSFDWRGSMRYSYDLFPSDFTMDDIALYDMPAAFSRIRQTVGQEARIHVISHCVGSLTFLMSLYAKRVGGVSSVISNSLSLTPRVPWWSKAKLTFAPVLFPHSMDLSPRWAFFPRHSIGRWLSRWISLPLWHPECSVRTCHIVSFMWGSGRPAAWMHDNLDDITHNRTADLFGSINMKYFRHIRKMVNKGVAVKMYPNDSRYDALPNNYLDYIQEIETPVLFVTGANNRIFLNSSVVAYETINQLKPNNKNAAWVFPGYGHQDIFMGKNCDKDIFPTLLEFLHRYSRDAGSPAKPTSRSVASSG